MARAFRTEQDLGNIRLDTGGASRTRIAPTSANVFGNALGNIGDGFASLALSNKNSGKREGRYLERVQAALSKINNSSEFQRSVLEFRATGVGRFGVNFAPQFDGFIKALKSPKLSIENGKITATNFLNLQSEHTGLSPQEAQAKQADQKSREVFQKQAFTFENALPQTSQALGMLAGKITTGNRKNGNPKQFGTGKEFPSVINVQNAFVAFHKEATHVQSLLAAGANSSTDIKISFQDPQFVEQHTQKVLGLFQNALFSLVNPKLIAAAGAGKLTATDMQITAAAVFSDFRSMLGQNGMGTMLGLDPSKFTALETAFTDLLVKAYSGTEARLQKQQLTAASLADTAASIESRRLTIEMQKISLANKIADQPTVEAKRQLDMANAKIGLYKALDVARSQACKGGPQGALFFSCFAFLRP